MNLICPYCHSPLAVADNWSGILVCPRCNGRVSVQPTAPPTGPAAPPAGFAVPPAGPAAPPVGQVVPPPSGSMPLGMPPQPAAPHGSGHASAPRTYRRKKDNTAVVVSILSVIGVLVVGGVMLVIAFSPRNESNGRGTAGSNPQTDGSSTPVAENPPAATRVTAKPPSPVEATSERVVRREPSIGLDSASRELGAAMRSWKAGESYETFIASDSQIARIDLPEWKDRGYSLEKSSMSPIRSTSKVERQIWLTLRFMNQGAEPLMRLYSVKLDENGKLVFAKLEDKAPPPERKRPVNPSPAEPPSEPATPAAPLTPTEEGTAGEPEGSR